MVEDCQLLLPQGFPFGLPELALVFAPEPVAQKEVGLPAAGVELAGQAVGIAGLVEPAAEVAGTAEVVPELVQNLGLAGRNPEPVAAAGLVGQSLGLLVVGQSPVAVAGQIPELVAGTGAELGAGQNHPELVDQQEHRLQFR